MMDFSKFRPAQPNSELVLDINGPDMREPIAHVNDHLNRLGTEYFLDIAESMVVDRKIGMEHVLVGSGEIELGEYSKEEVILSGGTFGNGIKLFPHMIARAATLSEMAFQAGKRDRLGKPIPVLALAAPSRYSRFDLSKQDKRSVARGGFDPIGKVYVDQIANLGFGVINGVFYSQLATIAAPLVSAATSKMNIGNVIVGEFPIKIKGFLGEGRGFESERKKDEIDVIEELFGTEGSGSDYIPGLLKEPGENFAIARGFGKLILHQQLQYLALRSSKTTFLHAEHSKVTPLKPAKNEYELAQAYAFLENISASLLNVIDRKKVPAGFDLSKVQVNSNHSFADRLGSSSTVFAASLV